jgi:acetyltransferase-like isoleucine patch superfamily enzyme
MVERLRRGASAQGHRFYPIWRDLQDVAARGYFRRAVGRVGSNCVVHDPCHLLNPQCVTIGENFFAFGGTRIEAVDSWASQLFSPRILIGDRVQLNYDVHIGAIGTLIIGNDVLIGSRVLITDHSHGRTDPASLQTKGLLRPLISKGPTVIEDNVWIGEGACILDGVRVGRNSVVGANAVVTRDVPPDTVVVGVPARHVLRSGADH